MPVRRVLTAATAAALAALALSGCSDPCQCPAHGELNVLVSETIGLYKVTLGGTACADGTVTQVDQWRVKVGFSHEGECAITVTPQNNARPAMTQNRTIILSEDPANCCPNGLLPNPPGDINVIPK